TTMCPAFLPGAIKVVKDPTLTISGLTPGFGSSGQDTAVVVGGAGFVSVPRVYLNPTGNPAGSVATALAAVTYQGPGTLTGVVCVVRVTDGDGTYFDYSAIGVTNASGNLNGFKAGPALITARRAPGASAGRPTAVARFVYVAGGDGGSEATPLDTVEAAPTG